MGFFSSIFGGGDTFSAREVRDHGDREDRVRVARANEKASPWSKGARAERERAERELQRHADKIGWWK